MKQTRSLLVKSLLGLTTVALVSSVVPTVAKADNVGPYTVLNTPNYNGQQIISLKVSDTSLSNPYNSTPIQGTVYDNDGINRITIVIKRGSDGAYWTGNNWTIGSIGFLASVGNDGNGSYNFFVTNGPPANGIAAGVNYLVQVEAVDGVGNRTLTQRTFVGKDE